MLLLAVVVVVFGLVTVAVVLAVIFLVSESMNEILAGLVVVDLIGELGIATSVILLSSEGATVDEEEEDAACSEASGDDDENEEDDESPAESETVVNWVPSRPITLLSWSSIFIRFVLHSSISILSLYLFHYIIIFLLI